MNIIKQIIKVIFAGLTAIIILSIIMCFYNLIPIHHDNPNKNTDYIWTGNSIWFNLNEGISWGRFDENGFNNQKVVENPEIIVLGSSHMEGVNVFSSQTVGAQLTDKLENRYSIYNLGISGHHFF